MHVAQTVPVYHLLWYFGES